MHTYIHTYIRMSQAASGRKLLAVHEMRVAVAVTVT